MQSNTARISQNMKRVKRVQKLITYYNQQITVLSGLAKKAEGIKKTAASDYNKAIPEITQLLSSLQDQIAHRQTFIFESERELEALAQTRYGLLKEREDTRKSGVAKVASDAPTKMALAVKRAQQFQTQQISSPGGIPSKAQIMVKN